MNYTVYLRPLNIDDASTSYKWRNNPQVWRFTEAKPANYVTPAIEAAWLAKVLKVEHDHRFAICLKENGQYIGNIQLLNVENRCADLHLFIGDTEFWGKGIGKEATALLLDYGFEKLKLQRITLGVHEGNLPAQFVYKKLGFRPHDKKGDFIGMYLTQMRYDWLRLKKSDNQRSNKVI